MTAALFTLLPSGRSSPAAAWSSSSATASPPSATASPSPPELAAALSDAGRDYRLALRLTPAGGAGPFQLAFEAARRETATDPAAPQHEAGFTLNAQF